MNHTHTPGPWRLDTRPNLPGHIKIFARDSETAFDIAYVYSDDREWRANARLISAAPDMLKTLKLIEHLWSQPELDTADMCDAMVDARAAIAKAEAA